MKYQHFKEKTNKFLNHPETIWAHLVQWIIIFLILYSGADFIVEHFYLDYYLKHQDIFTPIAWIVVSIFVVEYILRLWASPIRKKYAGSFYGIIDVLAIAPTFFSAINLMPLRMLRLLRLLRMTRLLRITKLMRYFQTENKLNTSRIIQENILKNLIVVVGLLIIYAPVKEFVLSINPAAYGDFMFANSILALAAMFGFFAYSYGDLNPNNTLERALAHVTTAFLLFPIGLIFIIIQIILFIQLEQTPSFVIAIIWIVYTAVLLWDFTNVIKVKENFNT